MWKSAFQPYIRVCAVCLCALAGPLWPAWLMMMQMLAVFCDTMEHFVAQGLHLALAPASPQHPASPLHGRTHGIVSQLLEWASSPAVCPLLPAGGRGALVEAWDALYDKQADDIREAVHALYHAPAATHYSPARLRDNLSLCWLLGRPRRASTDAVYALLRGWQWPAAGAGAAAERDVDGGAMRSYGSSGGGAGLQPLEEVDRWRVVAGAARRLEERADSADSITRRRAAASTDTAGRTADSAGRTAAAAADPLRPSVTSAPAPRSGGLVLDAPPQQDGAGSAAAIGSACSGEQFVAAVGAALIRLLQRLPQLEPEYRSYVLWQLPGIMGYMGMYLPVQTSSSGATPQPAGGSGSGEGGGHDDGSSVAGAKPASTRNSQRVPVAALPEELAVELLRALLADRGATDAVLVADVRCPQPVHGPPGLKTLALSAAQFLLQPGVGGPTLLPAAYPPHAASDGDGDSAQANGALEGQGRPPALAAG